MGADRVKQLLLFPMICYRIIRSTLVEGHTIVGFFPMYYVYNFLLMILQVLHIIWFIMICRLVHEFVVTGKVGILNVPSLSTLPLPPSADPLQLWTACFLCCCILRLFIPHLIYLYLVDWQMLYDRYFPANTRYWINVGSMLAQHHRHCSNI